MLSRVADSLYWMSRNGERTEQNAHILSMQLIKMLESSEQETAAQDDWETVLDICSAKEEFSFLYSSIQLENVVDYLTFSKENINSIVNTVSIVRENARITRNHIPNELWEVWNEFYLLLPKIPQTVNSSLADIHFFLNQIKKTSFTATGVIDASMARDLPYHFIKIGRWLERAEKTARILHVFYQKSKQAGETTTNDVAWRSALQFVNGADTYFNRFSPIINPDCVIRFLVTDVSFPRSIRYCIDHIWEAIKKLENEKVSHYSWRMYALLDTMMTEFHEDYLNSLAEEEIEYFLLQSLNRCIEFGKIFSETYYLMERESIM